MAIDKLTHFYLCKYPEEAAIILNQALTLDVNNILNELSPKEKGEVIVFLLNNVACEYIKSQSDEDVKKLFTGVPLKVAIRIALQLDAASLARVLSLVPTNLKIKITTLMHFGADSVAAKIDTDVFAFDENLSVRATIEAVRRFEEKLLHVVYVVDHEFKLVGYVDVRMLLLAERDKVLSEVMNRDIVFLPATTKLSAAHMHPAWERLNHLPVVNKNGQFLGTLSQRKLPKMLAPQKSAFTMVADNFISFLSSFINIFANTLEIYLTPEKVKHGTKHR